MSRFIVIVSFYIALVSASAIFQSCECVTDVDDDNTIVPKEFTLATFINAIPGSSALRLESYGIEIISGLAYEYEGYHYEAVPVGVAYIKISDAAENVIANSPFEFLSNTKYTNIFFGQSIFISSISLIDTFNISNDSAALRFVHASADAGRIEFSLIGNSTGTNQKLLLELRKSTGFESIAPGEYRLEVRNPDDENAILTYDINIMKGDAVSIILRGLKGKSGDLGINCIFVQH